MNTDGKDNNIEQMIIELRLYIDQLNATLNSDATKEQYKEIITLAGELNAFLTR